MAKKRSKRRRASSRKQEYPGWIWMLFGLAIGLSVAFAIYVRDTQPAPPKAAARQPASLESAIDDNGEATARKEPAREPAEEPQESRFTFYDMLPNFEVVIPEQETDVTAEVEPRPVVMPGLYILQAGSFTRYEDADRRRAELARDDRRQDLSPRSYRPDRRSRRTQPAAQPPARGKDRRHPHSPR